MGWVHLTHAHMHTLLRLLTNSRQRREYSKIVSRCARFTACLKRVILPPSPVLQVGLATLKLPDVNLRFNGSKCAFLMCVQLLGGGVGKQLLHSEIFPPFYRSQSTFLEISNLSSGSVAITFVLKHWPVSQPTINWLINPSTDGDFHSRVEKLDKVSHGFFSALYSFITVRFPFALKSTNYRGLRYWWGSSSSTAAPKEQCNRSHGESFPAHSFINERCWRFPVRQHFHRLHHSRVLSKNKK